MEHAVQRLGELERPKMTRVQCTWTGRTEKTARLSGITAGEVL